MLKLLSLVVCCIHLELCRCKAQRLALYLNYHYAKPSFYSKITEMPHINHHVLGISILHANILSYSSTCTSQKQILSGRCLVPLLLLYFVLYLFNNLKEDCFYLETPSKTDLKRLPNPEDFFFHFYGTWENMV